MPALCKRYIFSEVVMWTKMVGDFLNYFTYYVAVNPKRKQALLESNLPAIRLMFIR